MTVRYDKLWILLIKNKMKKGELAKAANLGDLMRLSVRQSVFVHVRLECPFHLKGALPLKQHYSLLDEILRSLKRHLGKRPLATASPALSSLRHRFY